MSGKTARVDLSDKFEIEGDPLATIHVWPSIDVRGTLCLDLEQVHGSEKYSVMLRLTKSDVRQLVTRLQKVKPYRTRKPGR